MTPVQPAGRPARRRPERVALLVARAANGVIGQSNDLPWHLPDDLRRFKALTTDHTIIMGRRTYESIGRPLPRRRSIVVTRDRAAHFAGVEIVHSLDEALERSASEEEVFIVGGEQIFREALPLADRVYLTEVHAPVAGDAKFPDLDETEWQVRSEEHHPADSRHAHRFTFKVLERVG